MTKTISRVCFFAASMAMFTIGGCSSSEGGSSGTVDVLLDQSGGEVTGSMMGSGNSVPLAGNNAAGRIARQGEDGSGAGGSITAMNPESGGMLPGGMAGSVPGGTNADMAGGVPASTEPQNICERLGLVAHAFKDPTGDVFGEIAGDLTANTLDGEVWRLSASWTGCESYVFLNYFPDLRLQKNGPWEGDLLWGSLLDELILAGPTNTHYVFVSDETMDAARIERLQGMKMRINEAINALVDDEDARSNWRAHFHFLTNRLSEFDGNIGDFVRSYLGYAFDPNNRVDLGNRGQAPAPLPFVFGIDRHQRYDAGGNLSPAVGQTDIWAMAAYLGHFYNHKGNLRDRLNADETSTIVPLLNENVAERILLRPAMLPDSATMAGFDTLEIDIEINCTFRNPFACSEWDRLAHLQYCLNEDCSERREIARWITQYWRRGIRHWVIDASPFLGFLRSGGEHSFRIEMGPGFERKTERLARFDLRLSTRGQPKAVGSTRIYTGGGFNGEYNNNHGPVMFDVPADVTRVELVSILSGHGQEGSNGCAEWCDHRHAYSINGNALDVISSPMVPGTARGCAQRADEGVPPGQWGNWAQSRAYWCPGLPVPAIRVDITDKVRKGAMNEATYQTTLRLREMPPGGNINMSTYIVWYRD